jgi:hypothetical protein
MRMRGRERNFLGAAIYLVKIVTQPLIKESKSAFN